eukprot:scaffold84419_cov52-Attheya_sp.AAC.3
MYLVKASQIFNGQKVHTQECRTTKGPSGGSKGDSKVRQKWTNVHRSILSHTTVAYSDNDDSNVSLQDATSTCMDGMSHSCGDEAGCNGGCKGNRDCLGTPARCSASPITECACGRYRLVRLGRVST